MLTNKVSPEEAEKEVKELGAIIQIHVQELVDYVVARYGSLPWRDFILLFMWSYIALIKKYIEQSSSSADKEFIKALLALSAYNLSALITYFQDKEKTSYIS